MSNNNSSVKWLHLSDIHYIANSKSGNKRFILDSLINYLCAKKLTVNELIITGDLRSSTQAIGKDDMDVLASEVSSYIWEIAIRVGINDENNIHIVPGNHDVDRNFPNRKMIVKGVITTCKQVYMDGEDVDGAIFDDDTVVALNNSFGFFERVLHKLYSREKALSIWARCTNCLHYFADKSNEHFNILCLNTALVSDKTETNELLLSHGHVHYILKELNKNDKPIIAIGHHPLSYLFGHEKGQIDMYFKNCGVYVYLAGHEHKSTYLLDNDVVHATQGCLVDKNETVISFGLGEYKKLNQRDTVGTINIVSHVYSSGQWSQDYTPGRVNAISHTIINRSTSDQRKRLKVPLLDVDKGYEQTLDVTEKEFIASLRRKKRSSAIGYLLAGLSHADHWANKISPQLFYDEFYIPPPPEEERIIDEKIRDLLNDETCNMLCIRGEAGSGKSTLIRTMAVRSLDERSEASLYRYYVLDCAETTRSSSVFFPCEAIKRHIKGELRRMSRASKNGDGIWEQFFKMVLGNITSLTRIKNDEDMSIFCDYITFVLQELEKDSIHRYSFLSNKVAGVNPTSDYGTWSQLALLLLILMTKNVLFNNDQKRKFVLVYDNIEKYTDYTSTPIPEIFNTPNIILNRLFNEFNENNVFGSALILANKDLVPYYRKDFTFVVCARYTTVINFVHEENKIFGDVDRYIIDRKFHNFAISALLKKLYYLKGKVSIDAPLTREVEKIIGVLLPKKYIADFPLSSQSDFATNNDEHDVKKFIEKKYIPLFNNDFRKAVRKLRTLYDKSVKSANKTWMEYVLSFSQDDHSETGKLKINASRFIMIKNVLNDYVKNGFFDYIGFPTNIDQKPFFHNRTRDILTYLCQSTTGIATVSEVVNFMSSAYERDDVVATILCLSAYVSQGDKQKQSLLSSWGYFIDVMDNGVNDIKTSLANARNDITIKIKLTAAGLCVANYMMLQFDFFSSRMSFSNEMPLIIMYDKSVKADAHSSAVEIIKQVYENMCNFVNGMLEDIVNEACNLKKHNCYPKMKAGEVIAVLIEHIAYIDRFRQLYWIECKDEIRNKDFLGYIKKYIDLLHSTIHKFDRHCKSVFHSLHIDISSKEIEYMRVVVLNRRFLDEDGSPFWSLRHESIFELKS